MKPACALSLWFEFCGKETSYQGESEQIPLERHATMDTKAR